MTRELTWTVNGHECKVTVQLTTSTTVYADGDNVRVPTCELAVYLEVDGSLVADGEPVRCDGLPSGRVSRMGRACLDEERTAQIEAMIAAVKSTPEWQAKVARMAKSAAESAKYAAHREQMRRVMGY